MQDIAPDRTRAFRMSLDIAASPDDVWRALTEAGEIVRWFATAAEVIPGEGGAMTWSWGEGWDWKTRITAWQPGRLLRLVQDAARPYDIQGRPLPPGEAEPAHIAIEFALETHQGRTRLRMVHSGFGTGAAWDDELEGITEGWQAELRSLRHYLERHRGKDRIYEIAWLTTTLPRDDAWARLLGPGGFALTPAEPAAGEGYEVVAPGGERLSGTVVLHLPRQTVAGTVRELDDGWFRLLTWSAPGGKTGVWAGLATYAGDEDQVRRFRDRARQALEQLFPA
jgi:uncharacterized protein YndB with AHSA1/START domain